MSLVLEEDFKCLIDEYLNKLVVSGRAVPLELVR